MQFCRSWVRVDKARWSAWTRCSRGLAGFSDRCSSPSCSPGMGLSPSGFCRFEFVFFFLEYFLKLHNLHKIGFFIFCSFSKARKLEQESWKIYIFVFFSPDISLAGASHCDHRFLRPPSANHLPGHREEHRQRQSHCHREFGWGWEIEKSGRKTADDLNFERNETGNTPVF